MNGVRTGMGNIQALRRLIQQVLLVDLGSFLVWNVAEALMVDGTITSHIARLIVREYHPVDIVATPVSALSSPPSDPPRHTCLYWRISSQGVRRGRFFGLVGHVRRVRRVRRAFASAGYADEGI